MTRQEVLEEVLRLHDTLQPIKQSLLEEIALNISGDFDWSFDYNQTEISVSQQVGDYQVIRTSVTGMEQIAYFKENGDYMAMPLSEYLSHIEGLTDDEADLIEDSLVCDLSIENDGEFSQTWINCKNGIVINLHNKENDGIGRTSVLGTKWIEVEKKEQLDTFYQYDESVHPVLLMNGYIPQDICCDGYDHNLWLHIQHADFMKMMLNSKFAEMTKKPFSTWYKYIHHPEEYMAAFKIASRHKYTITNEDEFLLLIDNLILMNKDYRNPKYILPDDLHAACEEWKQIAEHEQEKIRLRKEREIRRQLEEQAKADMARIDEILSGKSKEKANYVNHMSKYFGINISGGGFVITPLKSVDEFYEEGVMMNHCVFSMGYYKKFNSLILSCKNENGERLTTIEYDLRNEQIKQCYGFDDKVVSQDADIRKLLNDNKNIIRMAGMSA